MGTSSSSSYSQPASGLVAPPIELLLLVFSKNSLPSFCCASFGGGGGGWNKCLPWNLALSAHFRLRLTRRLNNNCKQIFLNTHFWPTPPFVVGPPHSSLTQQTNQPTLLENWGGRVHEWMNVNAKKCTPFFPFYRRKSLLEPKYFRKESYIFIVHCMLNIVYFSL